MQLIPQRRPKPPLKFNVHANYMRRLKRLRWFIVGLIIAGLAFTSFTVFIAKAFDDSHQAFSGAGVELFVWMALFTIGSFAAAFIVDRTERRPVIRIAYRLAFGEVVQLSLNEAAFLGANVYGPSWELMDRMYWNVDALARQLGTTPETMQHGMTMTYPKVKPGEPYAPVLVKLPPRDRRKIKAAVKLRATRPRQPAFNRRKATSRR